MHHQARRRAQLGGAIARQGLKVTFGPQSEHGLEDHKGGQRRQQRRQEHKKGYQFFSRVSAQGMG
jgi:hypothetical protein